MRIRFRDFDSRNVISVSPEARRILAQRTRDGKTKDCTVNDRGELAGSFSPDEFGWDTDEDGVLHVWHLKEEGGRARAEDAKPVLHSERLRQINERNAEVFCRGKR